MLVIDVEPTISVIPGEYIRVVKDSETSSTMKLEMWDTAGSEKMFSLFTKKLAIAPYIATYS